MAQGKIPVMKRKVKCMYHISLFTVQYIYVIYQFNSYSNFKLILLFQKLFTEVTCMTSIWWPGVELNVLYYQQVNNRENSKLGTIKHGQNSHPAKKKKIQHQMKVLQIPLRKITELAAQKIYRISRSIFYIS